MCSVEHINCVRGWSLAAALWAARDRPLTQYLCSTEYWISLSVRCLASNFLASEPGRNTPCVRVFVLPILFKNMNIRSAIGDGRGGIWDRRMAGMACDKFLGKQNYLEFVAKGLRAASFENRRKASHVSVWANKLFLQFLTWNRIRPFPSEPFFAR